jgi:hypothetical protein
MFHEMREVTRRVTRSASLICELIDMASARAVTAQCAGEVTIGGPEGLDQQRQ